MLPRLVVLSLLLVPALLAQPKAVRPKVVLVGDSIRLAYAPQVAKLLDGEADIVSPKWAHDSGDLRKKLDALILDHNADLVHFNVGLHDLKLSRTTGKHQQPIAEYEKNLEAIVARLKKTKATLVFALTTPVDDERGKKRKGGFERFNKDVNVYNAVAIKIMTKHDLIVHDLNALVTRSGGSDLISADGTHFTKEGIAVQARAVADCVRRQLAVRAASPRPLPPADEKATAAYQEAEKKRDAGVRDVFKKLPVGDFKLPESADEWKKRRADVLAIAKKSLGDLPARPRPAATLLSVERYPARKFAVESLLIPNGVDGEMTALMFIPDGVKKAPAILWLHSSSYNATQLLMRGYNGGDEPLGEVFVKAGYVVLAPDACWYGGRSGKGPGGATETTRAQHESLFKYHLWMGRTLWGMFVRDDQIALDYLCTRAEVDVKRIGATGMSMGSTRSWWLAALDDRVKCAVGVACLTRYHNLIAHGELRQHGVYYFVLGLLKHFDIEGLIALIAPRPFLALTGELDAGSPADGIRVIEERVGKVYAVLGAKEAFRSVRYAHTGHVYTPAMRKEMLAWFAKWLRE